VSSGEIDSSGEGTTTQLEETKYQNYKLKLESEKLQVLEAKCVQLWVVIFCGTCSASYTAIYQFETAN
jgi:hypothetical protein